MNTSCIRFGKIIFFAALVIGLSEGCVTRNNSDEISASVVERSKKNRPSWVQLESGKLHENGADLKFVQTRKFQTDLELGIRQTEDGAFNGSRTALIDRIKSKMVEVSAVKQMLESGYPMRKLDALILKEIENEEPEIAKIADIYYEKLQQDGGVRNLRRPVEFFNTFVLISVSKSKIARILSQIHLTLLNSPVPALQELGQVLENRDSALTH